MVILAVCAQNSRGKVGNINCLHERAETIYEFYNMLCEILRLQMLFCMLHYSLGELNEMVADKAHLIFHTLD
jgi:hypothetical protein